MKMDIVKFLAQGEQGTGQAYYLCLHDIQNTMAFCASLLN